MWDFIDNLKPLSCKFYYSRPENKKVWVNLCTYFFITFLNLIVFFLIILTNKSNEQILIRADFNSNFPFLRFNKTSPNPSNMSSPKWKNQKKIDRALKAHDGQQSHHRRATAALLQAPNSNMTLSSKKNCLMNCVPQTWLWKTNVARALYHSVQKYIKRRSSSANIDWYLIY